MYNTPPKFEPHYTCPQIFNNPLVKNTDKIIMQLEFDFDPIPSIKKLFFMTSGLFTNELCYTYKTSYGNATGYSKEQAMNHLLRLGYSKENANSLLLHAKRSQKWVVYQYQQSLGF